MPHPSPCFIGMCFKYFFPSFFSSPFLGGGYSQACWLCCLNFLFPQELGRKLKLFINRFRWIFVSLIACILMVLYSLVFRQKATTPTQPDLRSVSSDVVFFFFVVIITTVDLFGFGYFSDFWMISLAPTFSGFDKWTDIKGQERWMEIHPQPPSPLAVFST